MRGLLLSRHWLTLDFQQMCGGRDWGWWTNMGRLGWFLAYIHVRQHRLLPQKQIGYILLGASSIFSKFVHVRARHFNQNVYSRARGILLASVRRNTGIMFPLFFVVQTVHSKPYDVPRSYSLLGVPTCQVIAGISFLPKCLTSHPRPRASLK